MSYEIKDGRKIGVTSMVMLFLNLALAKYLLLVPSYLVNEVGTSAWLALLIKGASAAAVFAFFAFLYRPYVSLGLGEVSRRALGGFFGGTVNLILAAAVLRRGA